MARLVRIIVPGFPYHVTQWGNHRHERTGRPLGSETFLQTLDRILGRNLTLHLPGRKPLRGEK